MAKDMEVEWPDILVIIAYFILVIAFGIGSSLTNRGSVGGYFLAGRNMHWVLVGASLFASNIGSGHFVGLAGSGAASGIGIAVFELNAIFILMLLGWIFVPVYMSAGIYTMPEYMRKRFGGQRIQMYLAVLALLLYIFTKISADLYAGAIFINIALKWNLYISILILLFISAIFTVCGGLTAVIWTDFIQTIIMIGGALVLMAISFGEMSSYDEMVNRYMISYPNTTRYHMMRQDASYKYTKCGLTNPESMHMFRPVTDSDLPWTGVMFGLTISSIWYWCSDQVIVQRALASKNLSHAKAGTILAGYLKFLPLWLIVFPGMIARILYTDEVACADPTICKDICEQESGCTNIAYPLLVVRKMPVGVRGLMLAVMMSSLMSSLTSVFNSSSTIFTMDVWRKIRKRSSEMELMIVGRVFVLVLVGIGIAWIPIVQGFGELFHYIQSVTSYLAPPICAVYVLALASKRINEKGAFWGLMVGLVVGLVWFGLQSAYKAPLCGEEESRPTLIRKVHYLHFGIFLFFVTFFTTIIISLLTPPIDEKHLVRLTFWSRKQEGPRVDINTEAKLKARARKAEKAGGGGYDNPTGPHEMKVAVVSEVLASSKENIADSDDERSDYKRDLDDDEPVAMPWYKRAAYWLCGIEDIYKKRQRAFTDIDLLKEEEQSGMEALKEKPLWRRVANVNAIILMTLAVFLWAFYY